VTIGARDYLIEADAAYLSHIAPVFEPGMVKVYQLLARDSRTIVDVGANVGCTALLFSQLAQEVHAFEPSRHTFAVLQSNLARAEVANVRARRMALGSSRGTLELVSSPTFRAGSFVGSLAQVSEGHVSEQIDVVPLDDLALDAVDFIKIDTEGFDGEVVRGAAETLRKHRPAAVLELNHWCLNMARRQAVPDYLDQLAAVFPVLYAVSNDGETYLDVHDRDHRYHVMYHHMLGGDYANLVGAFGLERVGAFRQAYRCGYRPGR
jgi:FkbM family methyltransferase